MCVCGVLQVFLCSAGNPNSSWSAQWTCPSSSIAVIFWTLPGGANHTYTKKSILANCFHRIQLHCFVLDRNNSHSLLPSPFALPRYHQLTVVAGYPPQLWRPLLTLSTFRSVLATQPRLLLPLVQFQIRRTLSTARTLLPLV